MSAKWKTPRPVVGTNRGTRRGSVRTGSAGARAQLKNALPDVIGGGVLGGIVGTMPGLPVAMSVDSPVGIVVLVVLVLVGAAIGVRSVAWDGLMRSWYAARECWNEARGPWVSRSMAWRFEALDRSLAGLGERFDEDKELVGSVGRTILEARSRLVVACEELSQAKHSGAYDRDECAEVEGVITTEFDRIWNLVQSTRTALDDGRRLRRNPQLLEQVRSSLASDRVEQLNQELEIRHQVLREFEEA